MSHEFKVVLGIDHLMGVQMSLEFNMNEPRGMIDEEATSQKHFTLACLASGCEQVALGATDEMIDCNTCTQKEMVLLEYPLLAVMND